MTDQETSSDQGSFLTGLTVGMLAGAAGFFLFGTKDGSKIRKDLSKEWESAKLHLFTQGKVDNPHLTLKDVVSQFIASMAPDEVKSTRSSTARSKSPAAKAKPGSKKFKNT